MSERRVPVRTYRLVYDCNECGEGQMEYTGCSLSCNPVWHAHKCTHCYTEKNIQSMTYPQIVHEEIAVPSASYKIVQWMCPQCFHGQDHEGRCDRCRAPGVEPSAGVPQRQAEATVEEVNETAMKLFADIRFRSSLSWKESQPDNPEENDAYFDEGEDDAFYWDGSAWCSVGKKFREQVEVTEL